VVSWSKYVDEILKGNGRNESYQIGQYMYFPVVLIAYKTKFGNFFPIFILITFEGLRIKPRFQTTCYSTMATCLKINYVVLVCKERDSIPFEFVDMSSISPHNKSAISGTAVC